MVEDVILGLFAWLTGNRREKPLGVEKKEEGGGRSAEPGKKEVSFLPRPT